MSSAALGSLPEGEALEDGLDDEHQIPEDEELRRAAVERDVRESQRSFKHVIRDPGKGHVVVDTRQLGRKSKASKEARQLLVDQALATKDQDNERFTRKLRARFDRCPHTGLPASWDSVMLTHAICQYCL